MNREDFVDPDTYYKFCLNLDLINNSFDNIKTQYLRKKNVDQNSSYVKVKEVCAGTEYKLKCDSSNTYIETPTTVTYAYVSIIDTLKTMLRSDEIINLIKANKPSYESLLDGSTLKENPLFQKHKNSLQIQLYISTSFKLVIP